jgi:hypothetical protein
MAKDTAACPYCGTKVDILTGSLRPHLVGGKDKGDVCDGGGLSVDRLSAPAGVDEDAEKGNKS